MMRQGILPRRKVVTSSSGGLWHVHVKERGRTGFETTTFRQKGRDTTNIEPCGQPDGKIFWEVRGYFMAIQTSDLYS